MRFKKIESEGDALQYIGEVYNPFGYLYFVIDEDRDWWEKAEHGAVATATFSLPLHFGAAISTGGYWANLPPGPFHRMGASKKFASDIYRGAGRYAWSGVQAGSRWLPFAAATAFAVDMVANPLDSVFMRGATALFEAVDPWGLSSFEMR